MKNPVLLKSYTLEATVEGKEQAKIMATKLSQLTGVAEAIVVLEEKVAYLKVDEHFDLRGENKGKNRDEREIVYNNFPRNRFNELEKYMDRFTSSVGGAWIYIK